ncbi:L,D-transpeptidase family protein [Archangium lansingense]|uniref:L,D-transpeptidase family protein n=1 Tax=Archangium lansingense TaxID=2995310 RepID=A0ABT4AE50_9BACT|nr:L,D-transpeptidase family protein [Archangium lansinium]MCY1079962.1 L,D-transpeptidase family protein [Archangium lansinium]
MRSWPALLCCLLLGMPVLAAGGTPPPFESAVRAQGSNKALVYFYETRGFQPAWFSYDGAVRPQVGQYLAALCEAEAEGLWPGRYQRAELDEALRRLTLGGDPGDAWVKVELGLTSSFLTYATHLMSGQVSSRRLRWQTKRPGPVVLAAVLEGALASGDLAGTLRGLSPNHPGFVRLREALAHYRAIAAAGGWPLVPEGGTLERGMRDSRVAVVRERLRATGDLPPTPEERLLHPGAPGVGTVALVDELARAAMEIAPESPLRPTPEDLYDAELEEAVTTFQRRHGMAADGKVGRETLVALRVPVEKSIGQLLVNLERWRQAPRELEPRYVMVNLAAFELEAVEQGRTVLRMPVIVGAPEWSTPVLEDKVEYLVLNPEWHVPETITEEEVLPKLREDPGAAEALGLKVLDKATGQEVDPRTVDWNALEAGGLPYRFAQPPGESNPLGSVKFIFPNRFAIYLHDTPNPALFEQANRAFSHGCVRVAEPVKLADFMLRGHGGWTETSLAAAMKEGGEPRRVVLPAPVPVYLFYWTAFVDAEGRVGFREDLYRNDAEVLRALAVKPVQTAGESPAACGGVRG